MLNKIKVIGMFLKKEQPEDKINDVNPNSQGAENEIEKLLSKPEVEDKNSREPWFRFSLMVWAPSGSKTILRFVAQGEVAERIKKEVNQEEVMEVCGYLRNEKSGRQIIIKVVEFSKLDIHFEKIDKDSSNQVRLIGKIIDDLQALENNPEVLSFRLAVPREGVKSPLFFCRTKGELISEIKSNLKKGDVIRLEGFLQTVKAEDKNSKIGFSWVSSINCQGFTFLDVDSANVFESLDNLTRVFRKTEKIDFNKPKNKTSLDQ
jgi:Single-strand binding protein family